MINSLRTITVVCILGLCAGCASIQFTSQWRDSTVAIDGSASEWDNYIQYRPDINANVGLGIVNDEDYLYLCLTAEDRATVSKIIKAGLTFTFESPTYKGKPFGIHFPLGMEMKGEKGDTTATKVRVEASLQMLALLGPGQKDTTVMSVMQADSLGVMVRVTPSIEQCTYELKVPLKRTASTPYAISAGQDSVVSVTFETGEMTNPARMQQNGSIGGPDSGHGGQGFGGSDGFGGRHGSFGGESGGFGDVGGFAAGHGGPPDMQEPVKTTFILLLSRSPLKGK
jgi:hypothetical protein